MIKFFQTHKHLVVEPSSYPNLESDLDFPNPKDWENNGLRSMAADFPIIYFITFGATN